ncbi:MAG TPA: PKD domain-containing protein [Planctomycetota bacterium]|nr:PKD domain-containing protein [Planctomycetota bacterium]
MTYTARVASVAVLLVMGLSADSWALNGPWQNPPPLPAPSGRVVNVNTASGFVSACTNALAGDTIMLADGTYTVTRVRLINKNNVTIRSASGDPTRVVLQSKAWPATYDDLDDILRLEGSRNITIADITFGECHAYGLKLESLSGAPIQNIRVHHCRFINNGTRGIKGTLGVGTLVDGGLVQYCWFENTKVPPTTWQSGGDYITSVDCMVLNNWTFADNMFMNIKGANGGGRGAIFVWVDSRNVTVERNAFIGCDRSIAFGNPSGTPPHMTNGLIRNNFIRKGADTAIEVCATDANYGVRVYNNTIWTDDPTFGNAIHCLYDIIKADIRNNIIRGRTYGDLSRVAKSNNVESGIASNWFVNVTTDVDLHLTANATPVINTAVPLVDVPSDFDGNSRGAQPDCGADELGTVVVHDMARANSYDNGWESTWIDHCRSVYRSTGKSAGFVLQIGDSIAHANPYIQWPRYGAGQTASDGAITAWTRAAAWDASPNNTASLNGWYLAAADTSGIRGMTASGGIDTWELRYGNGNGGAAMPADTNPSTAAAKIADGVTYSGNLQITTLASAFNQAQFAVLMLGTNDANAGRSAVEFRANMDSIVDALEARNIVPVLSTVPPHYDSARNSTVNAYNNELRSMAQTRGLPLIDFNTEITLRRPGTSWNGTLLGLNDVHPSASGGGYSAASDPYAIGGDYTSHATGAACNEVGYLLRSWLTVQKLKEVKANVADVAVPPPTITQHPASRSVAAGQTATFSVVASGTGLSYQWQKNGANISGANGASYTTPATTTSDNGALFRVIVSNAGGSVTSNSATLTVTTTNSPPAASFTAAPTTGTAPLTVSFNASASADSDGTIAAYAWNFGNGQTASGVTASHTFAAGTYTVTLTVTDNGGATGSTTRTITANAAAQELIGHWKFDDGAGTTALDSSGKNNHGGLGNGPAWVAGRFGGALSFDGADDYVQVNNASVLEVGKSGGDFSVAYWIYLRQGPTGQWRSIAHKGNSDTERTFAMWLQPGANRIHYRISTVGNWNEGGDSASELAVNAWSHVAYVKAGGTLKLYINGALDSQVSLSGASASNTGAIYFGKDPWFPGVNSVLDDIRITNYGLSATEVANLFNAPVNQPPVARITASPSTGPAPLTVSLSGTGSTDVDGTIVSYAWSFGDGGTGSGASTSRTYPAGTYTVTLTVTDNAGATASTTQMITATTPVTGYVGHWKLDEGSGTSAADSSGNNNTGTVNGGATWAAGKVGGALSFDGIDDHVAVANAAVLEVGKAGADFTVAYWINLRQGATGAWRNIIHKGNADSDRTFAMWMHPYDNRLHYRVSTTASWNEGSDSTAQLALNAWTHVACVKSGNTLKLYLNGALDSQTTLAGATVSNTGPLYFGRDPWSPGVNSLMDEVRVANYALSAAEIAALSNVSSGASATYVKTDTTTKGNWNNAYGADGYNIIANAVSYPSYAAAAPAGKLDYVWAASTSDARAVKKAGSTDRIAACWYSGTDFTIDLNISGSSERQVAFYCLDWDTTSRAQTVEVRDYASNALLDTRSISSFNGGTYLVWGIKGRVLIRFTRTAGYNAVLSGIFFGGPAGGGTTSTPLSMTSAPTASPSAPKAQQTVTFTAAASGGTQPYTWLWNFGDGATSSAGASVTHAYAAAGSYTVTVTVTDADGATAQQSLVLNVAKAKATRSLTLSAATGVLNTEGTGKDRVTLAGTLPEATSVEGEASIDLNGETLSFTLNKRGQGKAEGNVLQINPKTGAFKLILKNRNLRSKLSGIALSLGLRLGGEEYSGSIEVTVTGSTGRPTRLKAK